MNTLYKKSADVITRQEGDGTLAFEQSAGNICIMNRASAFIWEHCTGDCSAEDIGLLVQQHFDLSKFSDGKSSLVDVISHHLDLMHKAKLVEAVETETGELEDVPCRRG